MNEAEDRDVSPGRPITCANCGQEIRRFIPGFYYGPGATDCPHCGYQPPPRPLWPTLLLLSGACILILGIGIAVGLLRARWGW